MSFQENSAHGTSLTMLYIEAAKQNEVQHGRDPKNLVERFDTCPIQFTLLRASFSSLLVTYCSTNRHHAAVVMHAVFSCYRGESTPVDGEKLDAIHEMLQLQPRGTLLDQEHPVCKDWEPEPNGGIKRIFCAAPKKNNIPQVFGRNLPSNSAQFLTAIGKPQPAQRSHLLVLISQVLTYARYLPGRIENWRLGPGGDDLRSPPFFKQQPDSPHFNQLFAALYDLIFSKLTNMGRLIPSRERTLLQIFKEKVPGTDQHLISAELIAYLKWLIYVAAYEDRSKVDHEKIYSREVVWLNKPENKMWRSCLYKELEEWYRVHPPSSKKRKSTGKAVGEIVDVDDDRQFISVDNFVDPLAGDAAATAAALAAAAAAAAQAGGAGVPA